MARLLSQGTDSISEQETIPVISSPWTETKTVIGLSSPMDDMK
jgi:hypothetical protein